MNIISLLFLNQNGSWINPKIKFVREKNTKYFFLNVSTVALHTAILHKVLSPRMIDKLALLVVW